MAARIATLPNAVTVTRLGLLPFYVLLLGDGRVVAACFLLGVLGATDWVDGWLARRFNQVSTVGAVLDPVADRLVFFVGVGASLWFEHFPVVLGVLILIRECSIALLMVGGTMLGMSRFPVTRLGKMATFAILCAVPWITIGAAGGAWTLVRIIGWIVAVPGLVMSYVAFFRYLPIVREHLALR